MKILHYITIFVGVFVVAISGEVKSQPAGYYNSAYGLTGLQLKSTLHHIINDHNAVSYSYLWTAFQTTDVRPNSKVWDIYSNTQYVFVDDQCGSYDSEGDCYNREHSWPQSWFNEAAPMKSDLFHIYPTDGYVNGVRSNYPFGEVGTATYVSSNGSKLGNCVTPGYSSKVFEPIDEYKGDLARSMFYMSVRYYTEDDGWASSGMTNKSEIKDWAMTMLLRWHESDPVSQKEIDRNNAIYAIQGNRNPFIDNPDFAPMIWDPGWSGGDFVVTLTAGNGGTIQPSGTVAVSEGASLTFALSAESCYEASQVLVNGSMVTLSDNTYTLSNIQEDIDVVALFDPVAPYVITATSGEGGSLTPEGPIQVPCGSNVIFTALPDEGYELVDIIVDGVSRGALLSYSFADVQQNHDIHAVFVEQGNAYCLPPALVETTTERKNVTISWSPVAGATDYGVFRDGSQITIVTGDYHYVDENLPDGRHCYAVMSYCVNDFSTLSEESCVHVDNQDVEEETSSTFVITPNPSNPGAVLTLSGIEGGTWSAPIMYDIGGRMVKIKYEKSDSQMLIQLPSDIQQGIYVLVINSAHATRALKVIVK